MTFQKILESRDVYAKDIKAAVQPILNVSEQNLEVVIDWDKIIIAASLTQGNQVLNIQFTYTLANKELAYTSSSQELVVQNGCVIGSLSISNTMYLRTLIDVNAAIQSIVGTEDTDVNVD